MVMLYLTLTFCLTWVPVLPFTVSREAVSRGPSSVASPKNITKHVSGVHDLLVQSTPSMFLSVERNIHTVERRLNHSVIDSTVNREPLSAAITDHQNTLLPNRRALSRYLRLPISSKIPSRPPKPGISEEQAAEASERFAEKHNEKTSKSSIRKTSNTNIPESSALVDGIDIDRWTFRRPGTRINTPFRSTGDDRNERTEPEQYGMFRERTVAEDLRSLVGNIPQIVQTETKDAVHVYADTVEKTGEPQWYRENAEEDEEEEEDGVAEDTLGDYGSEKGRADAQQGREDGELCICLESRCMTVYSFLDFCKKEPDLSLDCLDAMGYYGLKSCSMGGGEGARENE